MICLGVTALLTLIKVDGSLLGDNCTLVETVFLIMSPLLGQVGNGVKLFNSKATGSLIWILWLLFGTHILMNNCYHGSVYSVSVLEMVGCINNSSAIVESSRSTPTSGMFGLMDEVSMLDEIVQLLEAVGSRHIVHNSADTLIQTIEGLQIQRNFILPLILRHYKQLEASGLMERWRKVAILLRGKQATHLLGKEVGVKWFIKQLSGRRQVVVVFTEAATVSLEALTFTFVFWGGIAILGLVAFVVESRGKVVENIGLCYGQIVTFRCRVNPCRFRRNLVISMPQDHFGYLP